jgi:hypothetical protein
MQRLLVCCISFAQTRVSLAYSFSRPTLFLGTSDRRKIATTTALHLEEKGTHTFIDGLQYDSREAEILAMGGDPEFMNAIEDELLTEMNDLDETPPSLSFMKSLSLLEFQNEGDSGSWSPAKGLGPRPTSRPSHEILVGDTIEWDGTVDEDAYFDD